MPCVEGNMEDSGIDSDSKSILLGTQASVSNSSTREDSRSSGSNNCNATLSFDKNHMDNGMDSVYCKMSHKPAMKLKSTSQLQKRLEKQIQQAKKFRLKEQNLGGLPKKLIPRSRLNVPNSQMLIVSKTDSHPLVSWESESDDDLDYHPISKSSVKEISEQLLKDGYNLDLTPDDEDLDLIPPPKPLNQRCICCSLNCMCLIQ